MSPITVLRGFLIKNAIFNVVFFKKIKNIKKFFYLSEFKCSIVNYIIDLLFLIRKKIILDAET